MSYGSGGTKHLQVRLTCADGTVLRSHSQYYIPPTTASRYALTDKGVCLNCQTFATTSLFTDTRPFTDQIEPFATYAATGTVTVAYAANNTSGNIRRPLIVIEGYDPSYILTGPGADDYTYREFVGDKIFGGTDILYTPTNPGDKSNFNNQLSEVGQYDLVFLSFTNGVDYMQRNAYLVERLIQWVNASKQPLVAGGPKEPNIVLGMSMGGLIARYALRDMEARRVTNPSLPAHDTRLYISHDAPHQGANAPLGVQQAVKDLSQFNLMPGLPAAAVIPPLARVNRMLLAPASQQLLIYNTYTTNLRNNWLAEYNQLGYPQQCRCVATSEGSECGRAQDFGPYATLLNLQGSGLLSKQRDQQVRAAMAAGALGPGGILSLQIDPMGALPAITAYALFSLGNFDGTIDFVINALPNQQALQIFKGRLTINRNILGIIPVRVLHYVGNGYSSASMLPYDSAPGGIYNIQDVAGDVDVTELVRTNYPFPLSVNYLRPGFCFVPTGSALDLGRNQTPYTAADLSRSYSPNNPPTAPFATPFANFVTASRGNQGHILWTAQNSKWAFNEMQQTPQVFSCLAFCQAAPAISGAATVCGATETYAVNGLPPGATIYWGIQTEVPVSISYGPNSTFRVSYNATGRSQGGPVTLLATIVSECGQFSIERTIDAGGYAEVVPSTASVFSDAVFFLVTATQHAITATPTWQVDFVPDSGPRLALYYTYENTAHTKIRVRHNGLPGTGYINARYTVTDVCGYGIDNSAEVAVEARSLRLASTAPATLYPNPARETVDVYTTGASPEQPVTVRLFDAQGTLRIEQHNTSSETLHLSTEKLTAGLYFVHILRGQKILSRQQLRIEH